jgi:hypothetical protein
MAENSNNQPRTFEDVFGGVSVDPNIRNARSRFEEHPEFWKRRQGTSVLIRKRLMKISIKDKCMRRP